MEKNKKQARSEQQDEQTDSGWEERSSGRRRLFRQVPQSKLDFLRGHGSTENRRWGAGALRWLAEERMEKRVSGTAGARE